MMVTARSRRRHAALAQALIATILAALVFTPKVEFGSADATPPTAADISAQAALTITPAAS